VVEREACRDRLSWHVTDALATGGYDRESSQAKRDSDIHASSASREHGKRMTEASLTPHDAVVAWQKRRPCSSDCLAGCLSGCGGGATSKPEAQVRPDACMVQSAPRPKCSAGCIHGCRNGGHHGAMLQTRTQSVRCIKSAHRPEESRVGRPK
jgi:hypothetical protein